MEFDWVSIVSVVLAAVSLFAGGFWLKAKGKLSKLVTLGTEAVDVVQALSKALEDDKITKAEIEDLKKESADVKAAWKALVSKG